MVVTGVEGYNSLTNDNHNPFPVKMSNVRENDEVREFLCFHIATSFMKQNRSKLSAVIYCKTISKKKGITLKYTIIYLT